MLDDVPNGIKLAGLAIFGIGAIGAAALIRPEAAPDPAIAKPIVAVSTTAALPVPTESPDPWASEVAEEPPQEVLVGHDPAGRPIYRPQPAAKAGNEQAGSEQAAAEVDPADEAPAAEEEQ